MSRDFELGGTWLAGGLDRQSRTGLFFDMMMMIIITIIIVIIIIIAKGAL